MFLLNKEVTTSIPKSIKDSLLCLHFLYKTTLKSLNVPYVTSQIAWTCPHILLEEMHGWILTKLGRNHPQGPGIQKGVHMVHVATMGAQWEGPQGPKLCKF